MRIGVLALQGAFVEHEAILRELGAECFQIRQRGDLDREYDGIILPGGESTVMAKLLRDLQLFEPLQDQIQNGLPIFGTCAGLILLASRIEGEQSSGFGTMHITAKRNAYGRQMGSFHTTAAFGGQADVPMTFIRAPYIKRAEKSVEILAEVDGRIVAAREGSQLVTAFHPELTEDTRVHQYFLGMIEKGSCSG